MKSLAITLTPLFSSIINQSLITGVIPSILKHSIITPILKKNSLNINELSNFRPIAQLPLISKILEKIVFKQITTFIDLITYHVTYKVLLERTTVQKLR